MPFWWRDAHCGRGWNLCVVKPSFFIINLANPFQCICSPSCQRQDSFDISDNLLHTRLDSEHIVTKPVWNNRSR
jgi:hypothetical protein